MSWYGFTCHALHNDFGHHHGFRARLYKKHIDVTIHECGMALQINEYNNNSKNKNVTYGSAWNPYAYYALFQYIHKTLCSGYQASPDSMMFVAPPFKQEEWYKKKVVKYWGKAIHAEWSSLIQRMDSDKLDMARALFVANFKRGEFAGQEIMLNYGQISPEHRRDIVDFLPAAMLAEHHPEYFVPKDKKLYPPSIKESSGSMAEIQDLDAAEDMYAKEEFWNFRDQGAEDWRGFFCPESARLIPAQLTATLKAVKPGTSWQTVNKLSGVNLNRAITSKPELVVTTEAPHLHHSDTFMESDKDSILTSLKILSHKDAMGLGRKLSGRRTQDLIEATDLVQRVSHRNPKDMSNLTEKYVETQYSRKVQRLKTKVNLLPYVPDDDEDDDLGWI